MTNPPEYVNVPFGLLSTLNSQLSTESHLPVVAAIACATVFVPIDGWGNGPSALPAGQVAESAYWFSSL